MSTPLDGTHAPETGIGGAGAGVGVDTMPDLAAFVARVRRRRVWYDIAAAGIAAGAGATLVAVLTLALLLVVALTRAHSEWLSGASFPVIAIATIVAAAAAGWTLTKRAPVWRERALIDLVEADQPACHNLLVTAYELTREPALAHSPASSPAHASTPMPTHAQVKPYIRARVLSDAARVMQAIDLDALLPWRVIGNVTAFATLAVVVATASIAFVTLRSLPATRAGAQAAAASATTTSARGAATNAASAAAPAIQHVAIEVIPPPYVGLPSTTVRDPERLDLLAGSRLRLRIDAIADELTLELDGLTAQKLARSAGTQEMTVTPVQSGVLAISARTQSHADAAHRLIAVALTPDQPPVVNITVPGHDLQASDPQGRVRFVATATDDYGLRTLTLHYTKVSGSGERFEFKEAELPLTIVRGNARSWEGSAERGLKDLNVDVGDTIVYYAAATDNRPGQERAVSDSYVIEISQTGAAIAGGFAVPKDEDVFAISLNALIQKTEKLHNKRATMPAPEFTQAAAGLAIEQRMVRSEFLFSMGTHGRVEDEEEEAENSNEIQEGRLHNKGQSELSQAVDLMTLAERNLTDANTGDALKAQRAALAAVQRAQSRQRYFLRTIPIASRIDQSRRLTGNLSEAASSQHPPATSAPDTKAAALRALLTDCARLVALLDSTTSAPAPTPRPGTPAQQPTAAPLPAAPAQTPAAPAQQQAAAPPTSAQAASVASSSDTTRLTDLASGIGARMMALDPTSTPLHAAATSLLQVAPLAASGRRDDAKALVRSAAALLVPLAQRANDASAAGITPAADADSTDPALRGAVVDALRRTPRTTGSSGGPSSQPGPSGTTKPTGGQR